MKSDSQIPQNYVGVLLNSVVRRLYVMIVAQILISPFSKENTRIRLAGFVLL